MRGQTFDPFASLAYAARLMAAHLEHRDGVYHEALADYNTGANATGSFRAEGSRYADRILEGMDMASAQALETLRRDRDRNHDRKLAALHHLGEVIQVINRLGAARVPAADWTAAKTAEQFYHDPEAG